MAVEVSQSRHLITKRLFMDTVILIKLRFENYFCQSDSIIFFFRMYAIQKSDLHTFHLQFSYPTLEKKRTGSFSKSNWESGIMQRRDRQSVWHWRSNLLQSTACSWGFNSRSSSILPHRIGRPKIYIPRIIILPWTAHSNRRTRSLPHLHSCDSGRSPGCSVFYMLPHSHMIRKGSYYISGWGSTNS